MPATQTILLPTFLPHPGEQLHNAFPPNHDSLGSILGLGLAYLKSMHPAKLAQPDEFTQATAHLLNLFLHDPLAQSLLPKGTNVNTAPVKELTALQICLTSLENTLANLAKATTEVRKELKSKPSPPSQTANPATASVKGPAPTSSYAAMAATPQRPSVVVEAAAYTWPNNRRPVPSDICATINAALERTNATQVRASAARWTAKGNLVIWGNANTTAQQLTTAFPHFSEALQPSFSALAKGHQVNQKVLNGS
ncbi:hypothetical protein BJV78DRAFT_1286539 [Lactifluus subvellereus]|nr:hypothetical protein BJV78DRAFT_1286539 [Lactifluus subvellereus]